MRRATSWFCAERFASAKSRKAIPFWAVIAPFASLPPRRPFRRGGIFYIRPFSAYFFTLVIVLFCLLENYPVFFQKKACIFLWMCYNKSRSGGLAQLVRAPASHAGGLGFESLVLHHKPQLLSRLWFFVFVLQSKCGRASSKGNALPFSMAALLSHKLPPKPAGLWGACRFSGGYSAILFLGVLYWF